MKNLLILGLLTLGFAAPSFAQTEKAEVSIQAKEEIVLQAPVQPEFPGGMDGMITYFSDNVVYPKDAKDNNHQGTVYVEFVVEKDGSITNARSLRDANPLLTKEALRVINEMPNWKPAEDGDGNIVRTLMTLPVRFEL